MRNPPAKPAAKRSSTPKAASPAASATVSAKRIAQPAAPKIPSGAPVLRGDEEPDVLAGIPLTPQEVYRDALRASRWMDEDLELPPPLNDDMLVQLHKRMSMLNEAPMGPERSELIRHGYDLHELTPEQRYVFTTGLGPLEFFVRTYRNVYQTMNSRLKAATEAAKYIHKAVAAQVSMSVHNDDGLAVPGLGAFDPDRLSAKELEIFDNLLRKGCTDAKVKADA